MHTSEGGEGSEGSEGSPYRGLHVRRESLGVVHRSWAHFLSPGAKP
jgi:hypothetical protein